MRIIISGPFPTDSYSGGVAVFNRNIALELAKKNEILIVSNRKYNLNIHNIRSVRFWEFNEIRRFKSDVIISSLWYSLFFIFGFNNTIKIHIVHGFTNFVSYKPIKFNLMHLIDKVLRKHFDYFLANSKFTKFINEQIFDIKIDDVFLIGLDSDYIASLIQKDNQHTFSSPNIIFLGRIVPAKKIDVALKAVSKLDPNFFHEFRVYGYGPEEEKLKKMYSNNPKVVFKGSLNHGDVEKAYENSKVFISLNPSEPFGITYEEAIASGLFVVAPNTGGQVDFLREFPDRCALVDVDSIDSVKRGIEQGLNSKLSPMTDKQLDRMSYKQTIEKIISVINK